METSFFEFKENQELNKKRITIDLLKVVSYSENTNENVLTVSFSSHSVYLFIKYEAFQKIHVKAIQDNERCSNVSVIPLVEKV